MQSFWFVCKLLQRRASATLTCALLDRVEHLLPWREAQVSGLSEAGVTSLLRQPTTLEEVIQGFSTRVRQALANVSRHRVGALQRGRCHTANSCRPGLIGGILRLICDGICNSKRFHSDRDEQESRTGMPWSTSLHQALSRVPEVAPFFFFRFFVEGG